MPKAKKSGFFLIFSSILAIISQKLDLSTLFGVRVIDTLFEERLGENLQDKVDFKRL